MRGVVFHDYHAFGTSRPIFSSTAFMSSQTVFSVREQAGEHSEADDFDGELFLEVKVFVLERLPSRFCRKPVLTLRQMCRSALDVFETIAHSSTQLVSQPRALTAMSEARGSPPCT